jgi:hypothetical protein
METPRFAWREFLRRYVLASFRATLVAIGLASVSVGIAVWPAFTVCAAAVSAVVVLAVRAPAYGFLLALAVFSAEGWVKAYLARGGSPLPLSGVTLGAGVIDLAFIAGALGLIVADHGNELRRVWHRFNRVGRVSATLTAVWLIASAIQIFQSGRLVHGLDGFRLTQGYLLAVPAGLLLAAAAHRRRLVMPLLLLTLSLVSGYAALRTIIGPSAVERAFALSRPGVTQYGNAFRAVGSFSGAVGLASFLVPTGVFGFTLAVASRHYRVWGAVVFSLALVGIVGSYARAALIALAVGALVALVLSLSVSSLSRRSRVIAVVATSVALGVGVASTIVASEASPQTRTRMAAFVHPLRDKSLQIRLSTWKRSLRAVIHHPLGTGLGTVGSASSLEGGATVTTDNNYLKVLQEQGILVGALFVFGLLGICASLSSVIRRQTQSTRVLGAAALAAFVSLLVLSLFGEYLEQPGKVLAWTFLGFAAWQAYAAPATNA